MQDVVDPVRVVFQRVHKQMGAANILRLMRNLQGIAAEHMGSLEVGTLCSGCDLLMHVLTEMSYEWMSTWAIELKFDHSFACEIDPERQQFLINTWSPHRLFPDITKMNEDRAFCVRAQAMAPRCYICM